MIGLTGICGDFVIETFLVAGRNDEDSYCENSCESYRLNRRIGTLAVLGSVELACVAGVEVVPASGGLYLSIICVATQEARFSTILLDRCSL